MQLGYVVKSHKLYWNANPIRFKKLDWKIHNDSREWKQSSTRPKAEWWIVFTRVKSYVFSNPTFWTVWDWHSNIVCEILLHNPIAIHVVLVNTTCIDQYHTYWPIPHVLQTMWYLSQILDSSTYLLTLDAKLHDLQKMWYWSIHVVLVNTIWYWPIPHVLDIFLGFHLKLPVYMGKYVTVSYVVNSH